jgi:hypothetical protein
MTSPLISPEIERWRKLAMELSEVKRSYPVPLPVLLGEGVDVVRFFEKRWATIRENGAVVQVGLDSVAGKPGTLLTASLGDEIFSLVAAVGDAQANYRLEVERLPETPMKRALEVLGELRATLEYYFDDGVQDVEDARLAALAAAHPSGDHFTMDGLAVGLTDYAALAELHRAKLDGFGTFSVSLIDEAKSLAEALRLRPQVPATQTAAARDALDLRDRLLTLLDQRVGAVRAAARYVFRDEPEIVREVTSSYERRRRAAARTAAEDEAEADASEPVA